MWTFQVEMIMKLFCNSPRLKFLNADGYVSGQEMQARHTISFREEISGCRKLNIDTPSFKRYDEVPEKAAGALEETHIGIDKNLTQSLGICDFSRPLELIFQSIFA